MPVEPPIGVIGVGWVGLVSAACFAELGHDVWCRDIDPDKVAALREGQVPIHEPGLEEFVVRHADRLHFELDLAPVLEHARLLFVCVDTPPTYSGDADLSRVEAVVQELPSSSEHAIIMKSTVPVGTGASIRRWLQETGKDALGYVSNPEFLREGSAVEDFMRPDRVVIGAEPERTWPGDAVASLYERLESPIVRTDIASAEMIKLASNAFLSTKISFINEIANVCEEVGADVGEVAHGMGLDPRIGSKFLNAGAGFGGSCLVGDETVLVRDGSGARLTSLERLFEEQPDGDRRADRRVLRPASLEVLAWRDGEEEPEFLPVAALTRRRFAGEVVEVLTKMGRRVKCTPDHPFVTRNQTDEELHVREAAELSEEDWLPIAQHSPDWGEPEAERLDLLAAVSASELESEDVIVRPREAVIRQLAERSAGDRSRLLQHPRGSRARLYDVARSGAMRLEELERLGLSARGATIATARNGTHIPASMLADESFWRIVGLYIAKGHCGVDGKRHRLQWSFHPYDEDELVRDVVDFWERHGVKTSVYRRSTSKSVLISSRLLASFWLEVLGLGANCYEQRIPDLLWTQPEESKRALLAGLWLGDGSWSYVAHGPSVVLEYGTASRELVDGMLRLLGELGVVARLKVGRTAKSTCDNYWLVISGADQIEALLDLVPEVERPLIQASLERQAKRIAPTGYRRSSNAAWVRVVSTKREAFDGAVYSLEVPGAETFLATGGLVVHNCFPKDVAALKQLAGNSGYHFQLLTAVIEVNELQKRRVVNKLKKHLGSLVGKQVALLGLAFKPHTDDMREATSVVLAARLQGEGAQVRAFDPVAEEQARLLIPGVEMCDSALDVLIGADAAVLVTEWPEFAEIDLAEAKKRMKSPILVDGRNLLSPEEVRAAGFVYEGIGRL